MKFDGRDEDRAGDQSKAGDDESTADAQQEKAAEEVGAQDEFELDLEVDQRSKRRMTFEVPRHISSHSSDR